jgi:hypothetical protein
MVTERSRERLSRGSEVTEESGSGQGPKEAKARSASAQPTRGWELLRQLEEPGRPPAGERAGTSGPSPRSAARHAGGPPEAAGRKWPHQPVPTALPARSSCPAGPPRRSYTSRHAPHRPPTSTNATKSERTRKTRRPPPGGRAGVAGRSGSGGVEPVPFFRGSLSQPKTEAGSSSSRTYTRPPQCMQIRHMLPHRGALRRVVVYFLNQRRPRTPCDIFGHKPPM